MAYCTNSAFVMEAINRLCDSLTIALCSIESSDRENLSVSARTRLARAEEAIQQAGRIAWSIQDPHMHGALCPHVSDLSSRIDNTEHATLEVYRLLAPI